MANMYYMDLGETQEKRQASYREFVGFEEPYGGMIDKSILVC